ncbi:helix-turn-helix transcriptional regulator [Rhodovulum adriaticum]|uniref:HTH luxR-type domain-containing protein n=1 Tax=Rhodovulum adriaticum TaxID=35804 RepID=A0A4R2NP56_RHOAD|nr:LuxR family transcriptional regulator [Rhodovulum adriaticum]MBK1634576.1 hypothetical protein [Rhodovulum adriaticum]TCP23055.1 hypothetical protein EV656_10423 [Rhodovulum adriaticum]
MKRVPRNKFLDGCRIFCAGFFLWDIVDDLVKLQPSVLSYSDIVHMTIEALAVAVLLFSLRVSYQREHVLRRIGHDKDRTLSALRDCFDSLLRERFAEWELSAAESDVALLAFRGLRIGEIAAARGTREGTVKAQLSSVFRKAGVATRAEFMSLFIEDFLDLSTTHEGGTNTTLKTAT